MSTWSIKRQAVAIITVIAPILVIGVIIYVINIEPANCFDRKKNQNELGVDCGGECEAVCQTQASEVAILWSRVLNVIDDVYSVVALVENPNLSFEAYNVPYTFKLYDSENVLIYERKGETFFPSGSTFPIFEHALRTGQRIPARASFELRSTPFWENTKGDDLGTRIVSKNLTNEDSSPRLTVVIKNTTFTDIKSVEFVALIFDENNNLMNASKTTISDLEAEESDTIIFTWPKPLVSTATRIEITPVSYTR